jgi:hypothetical protein
MGAAAAFYLPLPGPRMIWQFGERGYDISLFDCLNGTASEDCKTGAKPPRWEDFENPQRKALYNVYRKLNYLKTTQPSLRNLGHFMDVGGYEKVVRFTAPELNVVIVGNFDVVGQEMNPGFPFGGVWYDYLNDDSLDVGNPGNAFNYGPGEYHVYIDRRIVPPATTYVQEPSSVTTSLENEDVIAFPNPMLDRVTIRANRPLNANDLITISDLSGRIVLTTTGTGSKEFTFSSENLESGIYLYRIAAGNSVFSGKLIKP